MGSDVVGMLHMVKYIFSIVFYFLFVYICSFSFLFYFILYFFSEGNYTRNGNELTLLPRFMAQLPAICVDGEFWYDLAAFIYSLHFYFLLLFDVYL